MYTKMWRCRMFVQAVLASKTNKQVQYEICRQHLSRPESLRVEKPASLRIEEKDEEFDLGSEFIKWFLFSVPVVTFGLGVWQVQRRKWKLDLIQSLAERTNAEPVDLPFELSELEDLEYCPVKVVGHFLHDRELLIGPRSLYKQDNTPTKRAGSFFSDPKTNQGWLVVTPFQLHDRDQIILVNRGWVHNRKKHISTREAGQIEGEIELTGIVRLNENRPPFMMKNMPEKGQWCYRDLNAMCEITGSAPVWLDARGMPDPAPGFPIPNQTRVGLPNDHLSYIITWFGLSFSTGYMWHRLFILKKALK